MCLKEDTGTQNVTEKPQQESMLLFEKFVIIYSDQEMQPVVPSSGEKPLLL